MSVNTEAQTPKLSKTNIYITRTKEILLKVSLTNYYTELYYVQSDGFFEIGCVIRAGAPGVDEPAVLGGGLLSGRTAGYQGAVPAQPHTPPPRAQPQVLSLPQLIHILEDTKWTIQTVCPLICTTAGHRPFSLSRRSTKWAFNPLIIFLILLQQAH